MLQTYRITDFKGVGPKIAEKLAKMGVITALDMLLHLPTRYQDKTRVTPIIDTLNDGEYLIEGEIVKVDLNQKQKDKKRLKLIISDGKFHLHILFMHVYPSMLRYKEGMSLRAFGKVKGYGSNKTMVHPEVWMLEQDSKIPVAQNLTPIYPKVEGVHQTLLRNLSAQILIILEKLHKKFLPEEILTKFNLPSFTKSVQLIHYPTPDILPDEIIEGTHYSVQRLIFEELLAQHLILLQKKQAQQKKSAYLLNTENSKKLLQKFLETLTFTPTNAQLKVIEEIKQDLAHVHPMLRLVQGDVGSGKTIVAACAAMLASGAGVQVALMAPTEILAEQHLQKFKTWCENQNIKVTWVAGSLTAKQKRSALEDIAMGLTQIAIGTHALFQESVQFKKLGLLIVDEQHRFGVHQRFLLKQKGELENITPHQLVLSATPIPRTLAQSLYADLDTSVIDELPPGRTPVETITVPQIRRDEIIIRIQSIVANGRQVYWVCPLIEESEKLEIEAAEVRQVELKQKLANLKIGLVHGKMHHVEKEKVMQEFKAKQIDILVATTVIEVGVDVANATLMIIENAERLGLSQLHQLRGRVGRGVNKSHCVLLYKAPLSQMAKKRLDMMRQTNDGFEIAKLDLKLRGAGEVLGTKQTGAIQYKVADIIRDQHLLPDVRSAAKIILKDFPEYTKPLIQRWVGEKKIYEKV